MNTGLLLKSDVTENFITKLVNHFFRFTFAKNDIDSTIFKINLKNVDLKKLHSR